MLLSSFLPPPHKQHTVQVSIFQATVRSAPNAGCTTHNKTINTSLGPAYDEFSFFFVFT